MTENDDKVRMPGVDRPGGPDFMNRLKDSLGRSPDAGLGDTPSEVTKYAPPKVREAAASKSPTPLQRIGEYVVNLKWHDAMAMGRGIKSKLEGENGIAVEQLVSAIQSWAWEWQTFIDDEQPGG